MWRYLKLDEEKHFQGLISRFCQISRCLVLFIIPRYNWVVYFAIAAALFMTWFFNRTRVGLNLRAVGEDPATADAAGINTTVYKYMATVIGGGICGIGGMYMSMVTTSGVWVHNCAQRVWMRLR